MRAGSIMSGRLVAPTVKTFFFEPTPSISVSIWLMTRSMAPPPDDPPPPPRLTAMESSSSKKSTHGEAVRARSKTLRTLASDSPKYALSSSGPFTEMKLDLHSFATALAMSVFPHPGGP